MLTTDMEKARSETHGIGKQEEVLTGSGRLQVKIATNLFLIWLDENLDTSSSYYLNGISQLSQIANMFKIYTDRDQSVDFLTDKGCPIITEDKLLMIFFILFVDLGG
jgi:hypothetical protein